MKRKRDNINDESEVKKEEEEEDNKSERSNGLENEQSPTNNNYDSCLNSPKITDICKQLYKRLEENNTLLKEFIQRKCSEKSISTFVKIQQELNKMIREKRLLIYNFCQVGIYRQSKHEITTDSKFTLKVSLRGEKTKDILNISKLIHNCTQQEDFEYQAFFKQVNTLIFNKSDELFNKIQSKEIKRLLKEIHLLFDPTQLTFDIRQLNQLEIVSGENLLSDMINSGNEVFLEWIQRKSEMLDDLDYLKLFKSEYELMITERRLFIPIWANILRMRNNRKNEESMNYCICKIITINKQKIDLNKKVTITIEFDKFAIYNVLKPVHDQIVNMLEGKADDKYLMELNDLQGKVVEVIDQGDD